MVDVQAVLFNGNRLACVYQHVTGLRSVSHPKRRMKSGTSSMLAVADWISRCLAPSLIKCQGGGELMRLFFKKYISYFSGNECTDIGSLSCSHQLVSSSLHLSALLV